MFACTRFTARTAAAALALGGLLPAQAQFTSVITTVTTTTANDPYNAEVEPLPRDCSFMVIPPDAFWDHRPRARPTLQKPKNSQFAAGSAQVVAGSWLPLNMRQVAFSYSFTRLALRIPSEYAGVFAPRSVRTTVFMGPTSAHPVASDRTVSGVDSVSWSNSVTQSRGTDGVMQNTWLVRNITTGWWQQGWGMPFMPAQVGMECVVTVKPASTTYVLQ